MRLNDGSADGKTQAHPMGFGSKEGIKDAIEMRHSARCDVRFTPESRRQMGALGCPLCAKSGHSALAKKQTFKSQWDR